MSEHKCAGEVWDRFHFRPCDRAGSYEHEGRWYCKPHHPPTEQAKRDARDKKFREDFESRQQASREAEKAHAEMQRKAAAYDGLIAQRDALLESLKQSLEEAIYPSKMLSDVYEKAFAAIKAVEEGK